MRRRVLGMALVVVLAALATPAAAGAATGWVPGADQVAPSGNVWGMTTVITPDRRTAAFWANYPRVSGAVRQPGGTFGEPFELDPGNANYVPQYLSAVALPDNEVLVAWSSPGADEMRVRSLAPDGTTTAARPPEVGGTRPAIAANAQGMVALAFYWYNQVQVAIRPAGSHTFDAPIVLTSLVGNEQPGPLDVTVRADGQVAVAIGTDVANPPGGTARMLIARRFNGATTVETVDSRALTLSPSPGVTNTASFRPAMELLVESNARQMLAYRLETVTNNITEHDLLAGPRNGSGGAPPLLDQAFGYYAGAKEHGLSVDEAGRPWLWWRHGTASDADDLRVRQASTAGAFSAPHQVLASPAFRTVEMKPFGAGRTGVLFTQAGKVKGSTSEVGAAFGAPVEIASQGAVPVSVPTAALAGAGEGSGVGVWVDGGTINTSALYATPFDATTPTLQDMQAPASLTAGVAGTFTATALDDWSTPSVSWLFGDGASLNGTSVQHAFPAAGSLSATATVTDAVGNTATGARTVTVTSAPSPPVTDLSNPGSQPGMAPPVATAKADTRAPGLSGVRFVPATLRRGLRSAELRFKVDEAATVAAQLERARPGFRSAGRCVAKRPASGTPKRCTRFVRSGSVLRRKVAAAGTGKLTIRRPRALGRYRVRVQAVDGAGNRSAERHAALTVR